MLTIIETQEIFSYSVPTSRESKLQEKWGSKIEIKNENLNDVMDLHRETGEDLSHNVDDWEKWNDRLK